MVHIPNSSDYDGHAGSNRKKSKRSAGQGSALLGGSLGPPASHLLKEASGPARQLGGSGNLLLELGCFRGEVGSREHLHTAATTRPMSLGTTG